MQSPLLSAALQHRLTAGLYQCKHTYANLLCKQMCTYPPSLQCSSDFGKMQSTLLSAALRHRQACIRANTAVQICSAYRRAVTYHHCNAALVLAKYSPHCSVLLCNRGLQQACTSANTPVQFCSANKCARTHQPARQHWSWQNAVPTAQCCSATQADSRLVPVQTHLCQNRLTAGSWRADTSMQICSACRCALTQHHCKAAVVLAECSPRCSVVLCRTG